MDQICQLVIPPDCCFLFWFHTNFGSYVNLQSLKYYTMEIFRTNKTSIKWRKLSSFNIYSEHWDRMKQNWNKHIQQWKMKHRDKSVDYLKYLIYFWVLFQITFGSNGNCWVKLVKEMSMHAQHVQEGMLLTNIIFLTRVFHMYIVWCQLTQLSGGWTHLWLLMWSRKKSYGKLTGYIT